jgi:alkaline phosphatase D
MKRYTLVGVSFLLLLASTAMSQPTAIVAGPMLGQVELRTAQVWLHVSPAVKRVSANVWKKGEMKKAQQFTYSGQYGSEFNRIKLTFSALEPGTKYQYQLIVDGKPSTSAQFTTQDLWQWRKPAPDFSFLTGSCAYFNEPPYDRPGKPYGQDSSIFEAMANEKNSAFMLWLGDNWYTREADYFSEWGLNKRAAKDRSIPVLQRFLKAMPHYAIWDDHDYGPDNADKSYVLKDASRNVFMSSWCNPGFGENGQGIYTQLTYSDMDIFMLDDRWFRSDDKTPDSIDGKQNADKRMFGAQQMEWLKNAIRLSNSNGNIHFRVIATGSQVLNPVSPNDCFRHFSAEYNEMMDFLAKENINGVVFLTGDRHLSQVLKKERPGLYPLYDVTASALTSGSTKFGTVEKSLAAMVLGIDGKQNYSRVSVSGEGPERKMLVEFLGLKGEKLGEWSIAAKDIYSNKP